MWRGYCPIERITQVCESIAGALENVVVMGNSGRGIGAEMSGAKAERRKVRSVRAGTSSLEATIPEGVVKQLDIQPGDELEWVVVHDTKKYARVRRVRSAEVDA